MKSLRKYAIFAILLATAGVKAQTASPPAVTAPATTTEMRVQAESIKKQIDDDVRHVLHLQAVVRKEKDVIKLTCVNDKLVQIKAHVNLFDTANMQLETAITNGDGTAEAAFGDVQQAGGDVKRLRGEADACAGELELYKQESATNVDRPPDLEDPTGGGGFSPPDIPELEPPGYATPFK